MRAQSPTEEIFRVAVAGVRCAGTEKTVPVAVAVPANDNDPEGDPLPAAGGGAEGSVALDARGTPTCPPSGKGNSTCRVVDAKDNSATAAVAVMLEDAKCAGGTGTLSSWAVPLAGGRRERGRGGPDRLDFRRNRETTTPPKEQVHNM